MHDCVACAFKFYGLYHCFNSNITWEIVVIFKLYDMRSIHYKTDCGQNMGKKFKFPKCGDSLDPQSSYTNYFKLKTLEIEHTQKGGFSEFSLSH